MGSGKHFSATLTLGGSITSGLKAAFGTTTTKLKEIGTEIRDLTRQQKALGASITEFTKLGKDVGALKNQYDGVAASVKRLRDQQAKLNEQRLRSERLQEKAGRLGMIGASVSAAGAVIGSPFMMGVKTAKDYQSEIGRVNALGLGPVESAKAIEYAKQIKTYGTSALDNLELMRDAMSVFGNREHAEMVLPLLAQMKFGNKAMFGAEKGEENTKQFMDMLKVIESRGGLSSESEFRKQANIIQQVISATGGRVTASEWRDLIATGGIAAKGMSNEALYYTMEHMVQEQGGHRIGTGIMSLYADLYQGHTTVRAARNLQKLGLIGDATKIHNDKTGQLSFMDPGALLGSDVFRRNQFEWMERVFLPALAKKGITSDDKIIDAIGSIVTNRRGADLLATMYMQRAQIHKSEALNAGAFNIDQLDAQGRQNTLGKEADLEAKISNLRLQMGKDILPLYARGLELVTGALEKFNDFAEKNPTLTKVMMVGIGGMAAGLVTLGPLLLTVASGMYVWATIGPSITAMLPVLAAGIRAIGSALLLNPIGLTITGIATAALLIYTYWDPIKAWAKNLWDDITATFRKALDWVTAKIEWVGEKWRATKQFFGFSDVDAMSGSTAGTSPTPLPVAASRSGGTTIHDNSQTTIHVTQNPGESQDAFVARVMREMDERKRVRDRSFMMDPVFP